MINISDNRIHSIDALRGWFAILVLFYQCSCWCYPYFSPYPMMKNALTLWGIYAVEGFFVISGMSLALAYKNYSFLHKYEYYKFFIRRYIRIVPLYSLLMLISTRFLSHIDQLFMVFGFSDPLASCLIGGWSIGVEFCLYFFFPLFILLFNYFSMKMVWLMSFVILYLSVHFRLRYVNPLQHVFFFVSGMVWGKIFKQDVLHQQKFLIIACLLFIIMSLLGPVEQKFCLENMFRLLWAIATVSLVFCVSKIKVENIFFQFLGKISYGLYLIHPIFVWKILPRLGLRNSILVVPYTFIFSIVSAYIIYRFFECPTSKFLKKILHA